METQLEGYAAIAGLIVTLIIFSLQQYSVNRSRVRDTYLKLELSSNEIFRFEAEYASILAAYKGAAAPGAAMRAEDDLVAENYYLQQLNLFEISARFRRTAIMEKSVFGSWVSWYYEVLTSWFFRANWPFMREHYTPELRDLFDAPVAQFDGFTDDAARKRAFFRHAAKVMGCPVIRDWLDNAGKPGRGAASA